MSRRRDQKGFTLVEIMMAVAIIAILAGVSFIGVAGYLRSMAQLERDGIAKEIFVAAQNHLSMAQGQNYLGRNVDATKGVAEDADSESEPDSKPKSDVHYYIVKAGSVTAGGSDGFENGMLGLMLPFASVDETVRMGGNYVIRYQANPARVLDVFYCPTRGHRYLYSLESGNYDTVKEAGGDENKSLRRRFPGGDSNGVIGWYGGGAELATGDTLKTPKIKVINKDTLTVEVTDSNPTGTPLQLIITGVTSKAQKAIDIRTTSDRVKDLGSGKYQIILDDITQDDITQKGLHFRELGADSGTFLPGEDITIQAVAYRNDVLTNVAYSSTKTTNSLFAGLDMESDTSAFGDEVTTTISSSTASVTYIRHLENLDQNVSSVSVDALKIQKAEQNSDLSWPDFLTNVGKTDAQIIYGSAFEEIKETAGCYHPVNVAYSLAYDGRGHQISDVLINHMGEKGVFGTYGVQTGSGCSIQNLAILDLKMISTVLEGDTDTNVGHHAGALAGSVENTAVTNVIAYNSSDFESRNTGNILTSGASSAGGLIGLMKGGSVTASAAAVYVESKDGNAGGLIGTIEANTLSGETSVGTITACYAGGHTEDGQYYTFKDASGNTTETKTGLYNVKGGAVAGGLIGSASTATITSSYSTCSVSGETAGGLVGTAGGDVSKCYATGLVSGTSKEGAFAGTFAGSAENCKYFEIINERIDDETGVTYLPAVAGVASTAGVEPFDKDAASYEAFTTGPWSEKVSPYDDTLKTYYQNKYNLKTVSQLGGSVTVPAAMTDYIDEYFVVIHHGDWPAPEVFVINTAGGGAAGG